MAQQTILGTDFVGAGGKDKINNNFTELYADKQNILSEGAFVDGDKTKLDGIDTGAEVNTVTSVNGRTGDVTGLAEASDIPDNTDFVDLTTAQTIAGVKTFSSSPIVPTPTAGTEAANKDYVDANAGGGGGGGGFNPLYPHGFGASYQGVVAATPYTVPTGKVLYITHTDIKSATSVVLTIGGLNAIRQTNSNSIDSYVQFVNPFIVPEGVTVGGAITIFGFICDANTNITPIYTSGVYDVPTGKKLVINNFLSAQRDIRINGLDFANGWYGLDQFDVSMNVMHGPLILDAGVSFNSLNDSLVNMFGYLIPDNFTI